MSQISSLCIRRPVDVKPTAETWGFMRQQRAVELLYELAVFCGQVLRHVFTAIALLLLLLLFHPSSFWQTLESSSRTVVNPSCLCVHMHIYMQGSKGCCLIHTEYNQSCVSKRTDGLEVQSQAECRYTSCWKLCCSTRFWLARNIHR